MSIGLYFRAVIISVEFVSLLLIVMAYSYWPTRVVAVGKAMIDNGKDLSGAVIYLVLLGIFVYSLRITREMLRAKTLDGRPLAKWSGYPHHKFRCYLTNFYCGTAFLLYIFAAQFWNDSADIWKLIILGSSCIAVLSIVSQYLASNKIQEIIES